MEHNHLSGGDIPVLAGEDFPGAYVLAVPLDGLGGVHPRAEACVEPPPQRAEALCRQVLHLIPGHGKEGVEQRGE